MEELLLQYALKQYDSMYVSVHSSNIELPKEQYFKVHQSFDLPVNFKYDVELDDYILNINATLIKYENNMALYSFNLNREEY